MNQSHAARESSSFEPGSINSALEKSRQGCAASPRGPALNLSVAIITSVYFDRKYYQLRANMLIYYDWINKN